MPPPPQESADVCENRGPNIKSKRTALRRDGWDKCKDILVGENRVENPDVDYNMTGIMCDGKPCTCDNYYQVDFYNIEGTLGNVCTNGRDGPKDADGHRGIICKARDKPCCVDPTHKMRADHSLWPGKWKCNKDIDPAAAAAAMAEAEKVGFWDSFLRMGEGDGD